MNAATSTASRKSRGAAYSALWVAKLIPLFDGFTLAHLGRWSRALERLAGEGETGGRAALQLFLSDRVLPEIVREDLPLAAKAWDLAGWDTVPDRLSESRGRGEELAGCAPFPEPAVVRAAMEARRLEAPREAFLAALLYDQVSRVVGRAAGLLCLNRKACRDLIARVLEEAPCLVESALRLQSEGLSA